MYGAMISSTKTKIQVQCLHWNKKIESILGHIRVTLNNYEIFCHQSRFVKTGSSIFTGTEIVLSHEVYQDYIVDVYKKYATLDIQISISLERFQNDTQNYNQYFPQELKI